MTTAVALLQAARAGEDRSLELANALAAEVLAHPAVALAFEVLAGGPLTIARAIRLAELVLAGHREQCPASSNAEGAS